MFFLAIHIGRLHPLLVHLPIGILLLAFLLELLNLRRPSEQNNNNLRLILAIAAISALVSLGSGWLLGEDGSYDESLLNWHRWMAIALTISTVALYFLKGAHASWARRLYFPFFIVALVLLSITGHLGGSLTHGEDYLFEDLSSAEIQIENVEEAAVYADLVQPILNRKCTSCHNSNKIKGGLMMTSKEQLLKGGDSGSILDSVEDQAPRIIQRLHLPLVDKEHMPPKGKVQLTPEEIALLEWWISLSNCFDCVVKEVEKTEKMHSVLKSFETDNSPRALIAREVDQVSDDWLMTLADSGISVYSLAEDSPLYIVNMAGMKNLDKAKFKLLRKNAENIVELNLANSNFSDTLASYIRPFKHLTKLQWQGTSITDKAISSIKDLEYLESLNLYGTSVTNGSLNIISELKGLKTVYLWQTDISSEELAAFGPAYPEIAVNHIPQDAFVATQLDPPAVVSATDFFKDTLLVSLENIFDDAILFYTLDGSEPDSTSLVYSEPLLLEESTRLKALTYKKGWEPSKVVSADFKKSDFEFDRVTLNKPPHEKYKGQEGKTLVDLKRGTINFVDGNWLGYESSHFTTTLSLKETKEISAVSVGALSAPANWIFFPTGFTVWTSEDGKNYEQVFNLKLPPQEPSIEVEKRFFDLELEPRQARYVRIKINSPLKNPSWHPVPGGNSFIFIDEVVLN